MKRIIEFISRNAWPFFIGAIVGAILMDVIFFILFRAICKQ